MDIHGTTMARDDTPATACRSAADAACADNPQIAALVELSAAMRQFTFVESFACFNDSFDPTLRVCLVMIDSGSMRAPARVALQSLRTPGLGRPPSNIAAAFASIGHAPIALAELTIKSKAYALAASLGPEAEKNLFAQCLHVDAREPADIGRQLNLHWLVDLMALSAQPRMPAKELPRKTASL